MEGPVDTLGDKAVNVTIVVILLALPWILSWQS